MATAKKKSSAKRTVKYAAKAAQNSARQTTQTAARGAQAAKAAASWVNNTAAEQWQKGASDWAKQSAKLYQLPFAQGDMGAAQQQAAEGVKAATESMVKMSNDMMQQMFSQQAKAASAQQSFDPAVFFKQFQSKMPQMPNFDMGAMLKQIPQMPNMPNFDMGSAQEKLSSFAKESSEQVNKASQGASRAAAEAMEAARENITTLTEVCNVAATVSKELAAEMVSYFNKQFAQNVELSKQFLTCRTLNDMFDLSTRITKANLDAFFSQSVKVSEMIFQCATDCSEPLNEAVSETSARMAKAMAV
ncbi:MAG: phasin family protein [Rickettsiales bacterium]